MIGERSMKKIELLAPAGNMECLKAVIIAGCDAVYLGGINFGARAYSKNFSNDEIIEAINYAHLYGVKVYVTVNTLIYDNEVDDLLNYVEFLHKNNVDAIIIQDLGMFDLIRKTFPNLELHASTQMHIHNLDGVKLMEKLGMHRAVLARETSIDEIKKIKENSNIELEIFIHGALCISYSGQCLMSSLIGGRSGNRGTCAGSCRLKYDVIDNDTKKKVNTNSYPLSTKDLNSLENIGKLIDIGVTSLKIEGRMKSKEYGYMVVSLYREAIDSYYQNGKVSFNEENLTKLKKIFNRDYTKGFLFNTENNDLINGYRPNHMGVKIGTVIDYKKNYATIKLTDTLTIGSGCRIIGKKDVGISVNEFYLNKKLVKSAHKSDIITLKVLDDVAIGSDFVITLDKQINDEIDDDILHNKRKVSINGILEAKEGENLKLILDDGIHKICKESIIIEKALNKPTSKEEVLEKLNKLGDTIYKFDNLQILMDNNVFIPIKEINNLRRLAVLELNNQRLYKIPFKKEKYNINVKDFEHTKLLTVLIDNKDDLKKLDRKYDIIYADCDIPNTIRRLPRVISEYPTNFDNCLVGDIGAFYRGKNLDTDFSLNVTNSYTVAFLHSLGANKITLSYEMNDKEIKLLIDSYHKRYQKHPNLELIVKGYEEVMISKFNINEYYKRNNLSLKDMYGNLYKIKEKNHNTIIYNYKMRNNYDDKYYDLGINSLRINKDI